MVPLCMFQRHQGVVASVAPHCGFTRLAFYRPDREVNFAEERPWDRVG